MASNDYYSKTKPNGMPDYIWEAQQAAQRAEAAKKNVGNKPNTTNSASSKKAEGAAPVKGTTTVPKTPTYDTLNSMIASDPLWIDDNTAMLEAKKAQARNEGKNVGATPMTSTNKTSNQGLTTEDARKEHIGIMNDPTMNPPTDGEITLGYLTGDNGTGGGSKGSGGNSGGGSGNGGLQGVVVNPGADATIGTPIIPTGTPTTPSGGYPIGGYGGGSAPSAPSGGYYNGANWSGGMSYKPYPTAEDMAGYVSTIIQAAKKELGDVISPEYMDAKAPDAPELRTLEDLAKTYGITYDYDSIYKILNDSVEKQYDAIYQRQKQNEDKYYDNAAAAQNTLLDTLSRDRSNAVSAGVSKGMQAANALGAMLGVSQQFANNATTLSQERSNTAKDYGASLAKAVVDAEATSNERKNAIMEISKMLYGYDSEQYVADVDNYNTILTNNAALQQTYMNNKASLQNALASIFGGVAANKITGDANVQSSTLAAEAQKYAAKLAADAQIHAANQNLAAQQAAAQASKEAQQLYADAMRDSALIGSGTYSGLLSNGTEFTGALAGNEIGTGTGTTDSGSSFNPLLWVDSLKTILNTGLLQNTLSNVKDVVKNTTGLTLAGLPTNLYK